MKREEYQPDPIPLWLAYHISLDKDRNAKNMVRRIKYDITHRIIKK